MKEISIDKKINIDKREKKNINMKKTIYEKKEGHRKVHIIDTIFYLISVQNAQFQYQIMFTNTLSDVKCFALSFLVTLKKKMFVS